MKSKQAKPVSLIIQHELSRDNADRLSALREAGGYPDVNSMFNEAIRLLEWAIEENGKKNKIASVDSFDQQVGVFQFQKPPSQNKERQ